MQWEVRLVGKVCRVGEWDNGGGEGGAVVVSFLLEGVPLVVRQPALPDEAAAFQRLGIETRCTALVGAVCCVSVQRLGSMLYQRPKAAG